MGLRAAAIPPRKGEKMEKMILVNKYDEEICELEWNKDTFCLYKVKYEDMNIFKYLEEGDEFKVKKVWSED